MTLLLGQKTAGSGANTTFGIEKAVGCKFTAAASGTVEEIELQIASGTSTASEVTVAVLKDNAGVPGTVVEKEVTRAVKPTESAGYLVTGLAAAVTSGTEYWIIALGVNGSIKLKLGTTTAEAVSTGKVKKISEAAWTVETKGPMGMAGSSFGEEKSIAGKATCTFGSSAAILGRTVRKLKASGKWATAATWEPEPATVPAISDEIVLDNSFNLEIASAAKCRTLEGAAYKGTVTFASSGSLNVGDGTLPLERNSAVSAFRLGGEAKYAVAGEPLVKLGSEAAGTQKVFSGGFANMPALTVGGGLGKSTVAKYVLEAAWKAKPDVAVTLVEGALDTNSQEVTCGQLVANGTKERELQLRKSVVTVNPSTLAAKTLLDLSGSELTFHAAESTIEVATTASPVSGETNQVIGGGQTFGTVTIAGKTVEISGANTFGTVNVNTAAAAVVPPGEFVLTAGSKLVTYLSSEEGEGGLTKSTWLRHELAGPGIPAGTVFVSEPKAGEFELSNAVETGKSGTRKLEVFHLGLLLREGQTQTVETFATNGKTGELAGLYASKGPGKTETVPSEAATLHKASGLVAVDYMRISNSTVDAAPKWYAGAHSLLVVNDTNWLPGGPEAFLAGKAPLTFAGTSTLKAQAKLNGKGPVVFAGTDRLTGEAKLVGTGKPGIGASLKFDQTAGMKAKGGLGASSRLTFAGTGTIKAQAKLNGTGTFMFSGSPRIAGTAKLAAASKFVYAGKTDLTTGSEFHISSSTRLQFATRGMLNGQGGLQARSPLVFSTRAGQFATLSVLEGTSRLTFGQHAGGTLEAGLAGSSTLHVRQRATLTYGAKPTGLSGTTNPRSLAGIVEAPEFT